MPDEPVLLGEGEGEEEEDPTAALQEEIDELKDRVSDLEAATSTLRHEMNELTPRVYSIELRITRLHS